MHTSSAIQNHFLSNTADCRIVLTIYMLTIDGKYYFKKNQIIIATQRFYSLIRTIFSIAIQQLNSQHRN